MPLIKWLNATAISLAVLMGLLALAAYGLLHLNEWCVMHFGRTEQRICRIENALFWFRVSATLTFGLATLLSAWIASRLAPSRPQLLAGMIFLLGAGFTVFMATRS